MATKQRRPKPKTKDGRRRAPNMTEKLAATLLHLKRGNGEPLVPADLREKSAEEICAAFDFDHIRYHACGGGLEPTNLTPMLREEHKEKSRGDQTKIKKAMRLEKAQEAFRASLLSKASSEPETEEKPSRGKFKASMPFGRGSKLKKRMDGKVVPR